MDLDEKKQTFMGLIFIHEEYDTRAHLSVTYSYFENVMSSKKA